MARTFTEIPTLKERLSIIYEYLTYVQKHPNLTVGRLKEKFAKDKDLSRYTVDRIDDFCWFAGLIETTYKLVKRVPRAFRTLTDRGSSVILRGYLTLGDFAEAPEWVRRAITRKIPPIIWGKISIPPFTFYLKSDWKYKLYVLTPKSWIDRSWQSDLFGKSYSVKHRAIIFLQTFELAPSYFAGYTFFDYPESVKRKRRAVRRVPSRWRTMRFDPNNLISVRRIGRKDDMIKWEVDFSTFASELVKIIDMHSLFFLIESRNYKAEKVEELWE